jgi:hypothetical protein
MERRRTQVLQINENLLAELEHYAKNRTQRLQHIMSAHCFYAQLASHTTNQFVLAQQPHFPLLDLPETAPDADWDHGSDSDLTP